MNQIKYSPPIPPLARYRAVPSVLIPTINGEGAGVGVGAGRTYGAVRGRGSAGSGSHRKHGIQELGERSTKRS
eukprot:6175347-Pleurochrysis_carterae.AAC.4